MIFGPLHFTALYVGAGIVGSLAQLYADRVRNDGIQRGGLGASGSVLGLATAFACFMPRATMQLYFIPMPNWMALLGMTTWSLMAIREGWQRGIGHEAHLGGMAFGALWYLVAMRGRTSFRRF